MARLPDEDGLVVGMINVYQIGKRATAHVIRHNKQATHVQPGSKNGKMTSLWRDDSWLIVVLLSANS